MITVDNLGRLASVRHGFFGRAGGLSTGIYASLNCGFGSGDDPALVALNRRRAMAMLDLPGDALATAYQVHGREVARVNQPWEPGAGPRVDAMVTTEPGIALGILTADCAPVLFADPAAGVIAAAHAGWRGAVGGVLEAALGAMVDLGARPDRVVAAVGPCIGPGSYEVGPEFPAPFVAERPDNDRFFAPGRRAGRFQFDLPGYVRHRLAALGLGAVEHVALDTCAEADRFFSYRRACLDGQGDYGRLLSAIVLAP
ncbi:MAG: peptidoglycan editing factor PgeF [Alphaproteobacteria bacterium]|nr:peptidoglycan editing factor PgeF [Alphaproteobacteria bacterium]